MVHYNSEMWLLQLLCSLWWIKFLISLSLKEITFQSFTVPNPPCLDEFQNKTETSYCLISHLIMSLQIDERVFHAYKTLASNCLHLLNSELAWTKISFQVVYWIDQKLFVALFWGSKKMQGACVDTVWTAARLWHACIIIWPHSKNSLAWGFPGVLGYACFHPAWLQYSRCTTGHRHVGRPSAQQMLQ